MTAPDVLGCPRCKRSVRKTLRRCPSCAAHLRLVRFRVKGEEVEQLMAFATLDDVRDFEEHVGAAEVDPDDPES